MFGLFSWVLQPILTNILTSKPVLTEGFLAPCSGELLVPAADQGSCSSSLSLFCYLRCFYRVIALLSCWLHMAQHLLENLKEKPK